jgi:hypothetical protein
MFERIIDSSSNPLRTFRFSKLLSKSFKASSKEDQSHLLVKTKCFTKSLVTRMKNSIDLEDF